MDPDYTEAEFEAWLTDVQRAPRQTLDDEVCELLRRDFEEGRKKHAAWQAQAAPSRSGRHPDLRYAVAIQDGNELGLTFWIKRSPKGEVFLFYPRDSEMDPHASYHIDGRYHQKSHDIRMNVQWRQPLNVNFNGEEHLGTFDGHGAGPRITDLSSFDDILVVQPGVLTGRSGKVAVDLVAPGVAPAARHRDILDVVAERTYSDAVPWIVVAVSK